MYLVRAISTAFDAIKRRIIKVRVLGKDDIQTCFESSPFGVDSNPFKDLQAVYAKTGDKGKTVIIGYIHKNQLAAVGETRLFSSDSAGGLKFWVWLKNDGTLELGGNTKHVANFEGLQTAFNELKTDFNNHIGNYNTHIHPGVTVGGGVTGITTPGTPSSADITGAKINEIKSL